MPLCTLYLLALRRTSTDPLNKFLATLASSQTRPLLVSRVIRWIILPSQLSTENLLARNIHWDILLVLPSSTKLDSSLESLVEHTWTVTAGVPSRLLEDFSSKNAKLLNLPANQVPPLSSGLKDPSVTESAQGLELSGDILSWIKDFHANGGAEGRGAISMFNLLSFKPQMKSSYLEYGKAFAKSIGNKRGGVAKIVGTVADVNGVVKKEDDGSWDEIAIAHYPSLLHFADMLAAEDYQKVNKKYRVPALKDTCILYTSEIEVHKALGGAQKPGGRL